MSLTGRLGWRGAHVRIRYEVSRYLKFLEGYERAQLKVTTSLSALNMGQNAIFSTSTPRRCRTEHAPPACVHNRWGASKTQSMQNAFCIGKSMHARAQGVLSV